MWLPRFACPDCRTAILANGAGLLSCEACGRAFPRRDGIHRFLSEEQVRAVEPFLRQYRAVRARDGYRASAPDYYRMLPVVARDDPRAPEWRIRRESYAHFQRWALPGVWQGPIHALDLGAGSGWLSHRLATFGHRAVAVDRLDDEVDGLGACRHYPVSFAVVQADFDALPFVDGQFEVVILNGSLHYAPDPLLTLREAKRMLAPGGAIAVMDSPMFSRARDGRSMAEAQLREFASTCGLDGAVHPGVGYLTFDGLAHAAWALGLQGRFVPSRGPMGWRIRRQWSRYRLGRPPAGFGVWVAQ